MNCFKLSLVIFLSFEFLCLVSGNPITSLFGKSDDKAEADEKTAVNTAAATTAKSAAGVTTTPGPSSSCGGLKGFLHICDKTATTEPPKSVKTRSVPEERDSDSDSDSDESKSDEDSDEDRKSSDATIAPTSSNYNDKIAKRQADDSDVSETSESSESENIPAEPEIPAPEELPLGLKKRQADESESSSESESDEEGSRRQRRDCRDGPNEQWKECKK